MSRMLVSIAFIAFLVVGVAQAQSQKPLPPGLEPYTPTKIEWLALMLQAGLRQDVTGENQFLLNIVQSDHETILIFVRYLPNVDRAVMNQAIETARHVIGIHTRALGWSWVKIKEDVKPGRRNSP